MLQNLHHHKEILKDDGTPYLVFTPFYNKSKSVFTKGHMQSYTIAEHSLYDTNYDGISKL